MVIGGDAVCDGGLSESRHLDGTVVASPLVKLNQ